MPRPAARAAEQLFGRELAFLLCKDRKKPCAAHLAIDCPCPPPVPQRKARARTIGARLKRELCRPQSIVLRHRWKDQRPHAFGVETCCDGNPLCSDGSNFKIQRGGMPDGDADIGLQPVNLTVVYGRQPYQPARKQFVRDRCDGFRQWTERHPPAFSSRR